MGNGSFRFLDPEAYRRGQTFTAVSRWASLGLGLLALIFLWGHPKARPWPALAVGLAYAAFTGTSHLLLKRNPRNRPLKVAHDVADAIAIGLGSFFSGAIESPLWLLLYLHVVAISVRGGLAYALAMGCLDAAIVGLLTWITPGEALVGFHALALFGCAFMGGTTSSYLHDVKRRLGEVNDEQERALARLRDSEARYRRLLERIQDGVLIIQDGRIVYSNEVFATMVEDTPEDLVGVDFRELVPPEDRRDLSERYERWQASQAVSGVLESRVRTRGDATLLVSLRAGSVEFEGRLSIIATVRDITRQREMEQDLKAHAERLAAINEIANAVNLSLTIEDILGVAADEARHLVQFDRLTIALLEEEGPGVELVTVGAAAGRQRAPFARPEVAWALRRPLAWLAGAEQPPARIKELLADDGVLAAATVPLFSKERVIGCMSLGRLRAQAFSTTELAVLEPVARHIAIALDNARLIEAARRRSHEFESLLEVGRAILARRDPAELLPLVTRSVNRLMGTSLCVLLLREGEELRLAAHEGLEPEVARAFSRLRVGESLSGWVAREGKPLAVVDMRQDPRAEFTALCDRYGYRSYLCVPLKRGPDVLGTLEVVTKEERRFGLDEQELMLAFAAQAAVAMDNARLFEDAHAQLARVEEANRRLEELDRLRQQYLRNVSHEFRTPLTVIKGYAEYLLGAEEPDERSLRDVMRVVVESCDRVIDLVDTLIEVSRVEQGAAQQTLQVQSLDLRELAESSLDPLRPLALKKGIAVALDFPDGPLRLQGDSGLLLQVVRKLLDNALKYSPEGGRVVVRGRAEEEALALEVEDQGIGIPPEHIPRIFEKFYTVDGGLARRAAGTGVGLYLVREIVRLHNGSVDVRSRPGNGSIFSVRLPRQFRSLPRSAALA